MQIFVTLYKFAMCLILFNLCMGAVTVCVRPVEECEKALKAYNFIYVLPGGWIACKIRTYGRDE